MRITIIGNPIAGIGQARERIHEFARSLQMRQHKVSVFLTRRAGEAKEFARRIDKKTDRIVIAGGDGTINEVLNGLKDPSKIPMLHLPTGTANQLAKTLGLPFSHKKLASVLEKGSIKYIDLGIIEKRRFLMLVSVGFDAWVTSEIQKYRNNPLGYVGYIFPILKTLPNYQPAPLDIILDNNVRLSGCQVMLLKVKHYGGIFVFSDQARLDSGHFDVCVFKDGKISRIFLYAFAGLLQKTEDLRDIGHYKARKIRIESEVPVPVEVDGDHFGFTPVEIRIKPASVPVVVPPNGESEKFYSPYSLQNFKLPNFGKIIRSTMRY